MMRRNDNEISAKACTTVSEFITTSAKQLPTIRNQLLAQSNDAEILRETVAKVYELSPDRCRKFLLIPTEREARNHSKMVLTVLKLLHSYAVPGSALYFPNVTKFGVYSTLSSIMAYFQALKASVLKAAALVEDISVPVLSSPEPEPEISGNSEDSSIKLPEDIVQSNGIRKELVNDAPDHPLPIGDQELIHDAENTSGDPSNEGAVRSSRGLSFSTYLQKSPSQVVPVIISPSHSPEHFKPPHEQLPNDVHIPSTSTGDYSKESIFAPFAVSNVGVAMSADESEAARHKLEDKQKMDVDSLTNVQGSLRGLKLDRLQTGSDKMEFTGGNMQSPKSPYAELAMAGGALFVGGVAAVAGAVPMVAAATGAAIAAGLTFGAFTPEASTAAEGLVEEKQNNVEHMEDEEKMKEIVGKPRDIFPREEPLGAEDTFVPDNVSQASTDVLSLDTSATESVAEEKLGAGVKPYEIVWTESRKQLLTENGFVENIGTKNENLPLNHVNDVKEVDQNIPKKLSTDVASPGKKNRRRKGGCCSKPSTVE